MSAMPITKLYSILVPKLGKQEAEGLINFVESKNSDLENKLKLLATKEDLASEISATKGELLLEIATTKSELKLDIAALNSELKVEIAQVEGKLESKIEKTSTATIKWMFIFWIGQAITTFGFILLFLRK